MDQNLDCRRRNQNSFMIPIEIPNERFCSNRIFFSNKKHTFEVKFHSASKIKTMNTYIDMGYLKYRILLARINGKNSRHNFDSDESCNRLYENDVY